MRTKRYRKKTIDVSEMFTVEEQKRIVKAIEDNYKLPKNRALEHSQVDFNTLASLLTFVLRKPFVRIIECNDTIYVRLAKESA